MSSLNISSAPGISVVLRNPLASSTTLLRPSGSLPRRPRPHQHVRDFRLSMWSSYLDPTFQKETQRRYRRIEKHKYIVALNRKLSWDRHFPIDSKHAGLKGFRCSAWRGQDSGGGGRWLNVDDLKSVDDFHRHSQEPQSGGNAPARNRRIVYEYIRDKSPMFGSKGANFTKPEPDATSRTDSSNDSANSITYGQEGFRKRFHQYMDTSIEPEYEIDPITNRRTPKESSVTKKMAPSSDDNSVKVSKEYQSQFHEFEPPTASADKTSPESANDFNSHRDSSRKLLELEEPLQKTGPDQDGLNVYDEKADYEFGKFYDCAGLELDYSDSVQNGLKHYDNKISGGKACTESEDKIAKSAHEPAEHDAEADHSSCSYSKRSEVKTLTEDPVMQAMNDCESTPTEPAGSVKKSDMASEPLGHFEHATKEYDVSEWYRQSLKRRYGDDLVRAIKDYEVKFPRSTMSSTSGETDLEKQNPVMKALEEYEITSEETKITHDGNGGRLDPVLKACREYKIASQKEPVDSMELLSAAGAQSNLDRVLKPPEHGRSHAEKSAEVSNSQQENLPVQEGLEAYDEKINNYHLPFNGKNRPINTFSFSPKSFNDRKFKPVVDDAAEDLDLLRSSDVRAASGITKGHLKENEAQKTARRRELQHDFETFCHTTAPPFEKVPGLENSRKLVEDLRIEHSELLNHAAHARGRIDAKIAEVEAGWPEEPTRSPRKMTGNFVRDFPEEFEASWAANPGSETLMSKSKAGKDSNTEPFIIGTAPNEPYSANPGNPRMETSLDRALSQNVERKVEEDLMQGEGDIAPTVRLFSPPESQQKIDKNASRHTDMSRRRTADFMPKSAGEKDSSPIRAVQSIYEDAHGEGNPAHREVPVFQPAPFETKYTNTSASGGQSSDSLAKTPEPTLYKILAYDPTMQSVSTAETTSIVPDSSDPLTPAEVLLRLSNPSKFFPHFSALQSQGYEIVAGSGDVLVFRKVRSGPAAVASSKIIKSEGDAAAELAAAERMRVTNPIDGMQAPPMAATGDFASPTGFVNHDLPRGSEDEIPFKSNIDVRREEPVFSGRRNWKDVSNKGERGKKKKGGKGRARKVFVGAIGVAGFSYALGVMSEFFRAGAAGGKGPGGV
ncbi:conserved serine-threonine rich protein [Drepanopeziza brunnea f. sp. 'multigermtubi' MB_m1]|uniref:Conserved serine-threonine rich protein n=2 Tax=Drepanopeziza brunnea f. sp. 'multigermtubi' TaxID=698441 RepID=K1Y3B7_MARBU|nr:conserved serine-threonine rich protein [Drepanopeziza brunnea f. sp. 'multigermtubi' MB_m1]EKD19629.1 conserved serine-threonine rich protein [Drepanopeziza brunnea f. sp. 'multigermtubi' MB_m1]